MQLVANAAISGWRGAFPQKGAIMMKYLYESDLVSSLSAVIEVEILGVDGRGHLPDHMRELAQS